MASSYFALRSCAFMYDNFRQVCFGICLALAIGTSASGALIVQSLGYDGSVRIDAAAAVEEHDVAAPFQALAFNIPLPATNALAAPFDPPHDLLITSVDSTPAAPLNGNLYPRMTIWIQNTNPLEDFDMFANPLDTTVPYPVRLDLSLYLDDLAPGKLLIVHPRYETIEEALPPFPAFAEIAPSTGRGSQSDPLLLHLGLPASAVDGDFNENWLKTHLYYETGDVPEPSAALLALVGIAVASATRRRG